MDELDVLHKMNWKPMLFGFAVGCIVATIGGELAQSPTEPIALHTLEVQAVDSDTLSPVPVTGIRYPEHRDFTLSTKKPERRNLHRVNLGTESGLTRLVWIGRGSADEYRFTLSAHGYEDVVVPTEFIEITDGSSSGIQEKPDILRMKKAEQASAGQPATRPELESEGSYKPQPESEGRSR